MAGFVMRKHQRLKRLVPVRYLRDGMAGEGADGGEERIAMPREEVHVADASQW